MAIIKAGGGIRKTSSSVKSKATGSSALHKSATKQFGTNYATSKSTATKASRILRTSSSPKQKSIAASVLVQRNTKRK